MSPRIFEAHRQTNREWNALLFQMFMGVSNKNSAVALAPAIKYDDNHSKHPHLARISERWHRRSHAASVRKGSRTAVMTARRHDRCTADDLLHRTKSSASGQERTIQRDIGFRSH
jgi:hypothetical protein